MDSAISSGILYFSTFCIAFYMSIGNCLGEGVETNNKLPQDIEFKITDFQFQDFINTDCRIIIKAKSMQRRGKKILGFRSNLIKYSIFDKISGELKTNKSKVIFSSDYAEWDFKALNSLVLKGNVFLKINGFNLQVKKKAEINFINSTIKIDENNEVKY